MQLHFEKDELNLLADILLQEAGRMSSRPDSAEASHSAICPNVPGIDTLLDKILARDLRLDTDELEQLADLLSAERRTLAGREGSGDSHTTELEQRRVLLDRLLERVNETCVMF